MPLLDSDPAQSDERGNSKSKCNASRQHQRKHKSKTDRDMPSQTRSYLIVRRWHSSTNSGGQQEHGDECYSFRFFKELKRRRRRRTAVAITILAIVLVSIAANMIHIPKHIPPDKNSRCSNQSGSSMTAIQNKTWSQKAKQIGNWNRRVNIAIDN